MVVISFFGDQVLVGQRTEELGIGINLGTDSSIDTKKSKSFLNGDLAHRTVDAVNELLINPEYQRRLNNLELTKIRLTDVVDRYFPRIWAKSATQ